MLVDRTQSKFLREYYLKIFENEGNDRGTLQNYRAQILLLDCDQGSYRSLFGLDSHLKTLLWWLGPGVDSDCLSTPCLGRGESTKHYRTMKLTKSVVTNLIPDET